MKISTNFQIAKKSIFDTMHPLDGQGVHCGLPKAIVFFVDEFSE